MLVELGTLKPGDTYGGNKYRVLSNEDGLILVLRLSDNWQIAFHDKSINWKHKVKRD